MESLKKELGIEQLQPGNTEVSINYISTHNPWTSKQWLCVPTQLGFSWLSPRFGLWIGRYLAYGVIMLLTDLRPFMCRRIVRIERAAV